MVGGRSCYAPRGSKRWPSSRMPWAAAKVGQSAGGVKPTAVPKSRQIHKAGAIDSSAYFPAELRASLHMVQGKTGSNLKDCLAAALRDFFRKHNAPISVELGEVR
jgi:hypothetical protein